jgi:hypothetical protein
MLSLREEQEDEAAPAQTDGESPNPQTRGGCLPKLDWWIKGGMTFVFIPVVLIAAAVAFKVCKAKK